MVRIAVTRYKCARVCVDSKFAVNQALAVVCDHEVVLRNINLTGVVFNDHVALRLRVENTAKRCFRNSENTTRAANFVLKPFVAIVYFSFGARFVGLEILQNCYQHLRSVSTIEMRALRAESTASLRVTYMSIFGALVRKHAIPSVLF